MLKGSVVGESKKRLVLGRRRICLDYGVPWYVQRRGLKGLDVVIEHERVAERGGILKETS